MIKTNNFRIIFMGTPDFAVDSLKKLIETGFNIVAVITAPDKPAGRGRNLKQSPVKKFALTNNLKILQPKNLKSVQFINKLKTLKADLQIVVAFRMLPEKVWAMPKYGTINLHASLLPDYRGAAPINHAIINGETKTGITTFFIEKQIDTGEIIYRKEVDIFPEETAGKLHDKLMTEGAELIVKTVNAIISNNYTKIKQEKLIKNKNPKKAPKIFKEDCKINWSNNANNIHNFIRGLNPYPTAWTEMINTKTGKKLTCKIFTVEKINENHNYNFGKIISNSKNELKISVKNGFISILSLQLAGKKRMKTKEFLNGFDISKYEIFMK